MEYFFSRQKYFSLLLMFVWTIFIIFFTKLYLSCSEVHYTTPQQIEKCEEQRPTDDNIHGFLIPSDEALSRADDEQLADIYWRYVNTIQALCYNQTRLGSLKDGGKEICMDDEYKLKMPCIVYSFGSNGAYDFEMDIVRKYGCTVHTFDPSNKKKVERRPYGVKVHFMGLGDKDFTNSMDWEMRRLSTIFRQLNHEEEKIDILKIDIEGGEWEAFPDIFATNSLRNVRQISMEVHFGYKWSSEGDGIVKQLKVLRTLYEYGFRIFMRDHNILTRQKKSDGYMTTCNEISLVNIHKANTSRDVFIERFL